MQNVLPSGSIRSKNLATGPGVGVFGSGLDDAGVPVPAFTVLQSTARAALLSVQSVKYIMRNTSSRNHIRDVTMTTLNVSAVRRFIVQFTRRQHKHI